VPFDHLFRFLIPQIDLEKAIKILKILKSAYNGMDEVSTSYNKGYQKPGDTT
jgi:hypothetical protein